MLFDDELLENNTGMVGRTAAAAAAASLSVAEKFLCYHDDDDCTAPPHQSLPAHTHKKNNLWQPSKWTEIEHKRHIMKVACVSHLFAQ